MKIALITLFPEMFSSLTEYGISGRAVKAGLVECQSFNPRDFTARPSPDSRRTPLRRRPRHGDDGRASAQGDSRR